MSRSITDIEDRLIALLKDGTTARTVKSYQGEMDSRDIKRLLNLFPAIFVVYGGSRYTARGARKLETMSFELFVCDKSLRAEEEARRGGIGNPGVYALLAAIRDCLCGVLPYPEMEPMELIREEAVWFGGGISIFGAEYQTIQGHLYPAA